jgi:serine/threonine-protein kinase SRPK3
MNREVEAYRHLQTGRSSHIGRQFIRQLLDSFEIVQPDGAHHHCLIHPPLHKTLRDLQKLGDKPTGLPEDMVRGVLRHLFQALDFLHTDANITHCGTNRCPVYR